jgi:fluoroquinolone resistance protein
MIDGMDKPLIRQKDFEKIDFTKNLLPKAEYEACTFLNCTFYNSDLSNVNFEKCTFEGCDFSLAKLKNTVFMDVKFMNCKLLGLHFDDCNDFILTVCFENCLLKLSSFYKLKLRKTTFANCNMQEADFSEADLSGSIFENCDMHRAIFSFTNLEKTDFYSSFHYSIDPEKNRIKKARFSKAEVMGLLDQYDLRIE